MTACTTRERWAGGLGYRSQKVFWRAIEKYGWNNIKHDILMTNLSYEEAKRYEQLYILLFKTNYKQFRNPTYGYNMNAGGNAREKGFHLSSETKKKLSCSSYNEPRKTPLDIFDLDGNYIGTAQTYNEAEEMTGQYKTNILKVVKGRCNQMGGFQFRYHDDNNINGISAYRKKIPRSCLSKYNDPVYQYDLDGKYISEYDNPSVAGKVTGIPSKGIINCAKGIYGTSYGYIWLFEKHKQIPPRVDKTTYKKKINQIDLDGNHVKTFDSLADAARSINAKSSANILKVIHGERSQSGGYKWEYVS